MGDLLDEVRRSYCAKYPLDDLDDEGFNVGYDTDGLLWVQHTGPGLSDSRSRKEAGDQELAFRVSKLGMLQNMLGEVKRLYNERYPLDSVDDLCGEVGYDADGLLWVKSMGLGPWVAQSAV